MWTRYRRRQLRRSTGYRCKYLQVINAELSGQNKLRSQATPQSNYSNSEARRSLVRPVTTEWIFSNVRITDDLHACSCSYSRVTCRVTIVFFYIQMPKRVKRVYWNDGCAGYVSLNYEILRLSLLQATASLLERISVSDIDGVWRICLAEAQWHLPAAE